MLIKKIGKLALDYIGGMHNNIHVLQLKGKDVLNWTCQSLDMGSVLCHERKTCLLSVS